MVLLVLALVVALTVYLYVAVPKGFFPEQDSPMLGAGVRADESSSFQSMQSKLRDVFAVIRSDPAVDTVVGFTGGRRAGGAFMSVALKPEGERTASGREVIDRLRPRLEAVPGLRTFLFPFQAVRVGGRSSNASYSYLLISDDTASLYATTARLAAILRTRPELTDIDTDLEQNGSESYVQIDRDRAASLGISPRDIDNALYNAFGQREVATIYEDVNQYGVILEWDQDAAQGPAALTDVYVPANAAADRPSSDATTVRTSGDTLSTGARAAAGDAGSAPDRGGGVAEGDVTNPTLRDPRHRAQHGAAAHGAAVGDRVLPHQPDRDQRRAPERRGGDRHLVQPGRGRDAERSAGNHC